MIFVTVGTHEQPFDRLVQTIDDLLEKKILTEEVFIQTGYSRYKPRFCEFAEFIGFDQMMIRIKESRVVVTHGGTGSIMLALYKGKIPVVMPRKKEFNEHIDNHQVHFCRMMETRKKILAVYETNELGPILNNYEVKIKTLCDVSTHNNSQNQTDNQTENQTQHQTGNQTQAQTPIQPLTLEERVGMFSRKLMDICDRWEYRK